MKRKEHRSTAVTMTASAAAAAAMAVVPAAASHRRLSGSRLKLNNIKFHIYGFQSGTVVNANTSVSTFLFAYGARASIRVRSRSVCFQCHAQVSRFATPGMQRFLFIIIRCCFGQDGNCLKQNASIDDEVALSAHASIYQFMCALCTLKIPSVSVHMHHAQNTACT